jgi:hypothetical protein
MAAEQCGTSAMPYKAAGRQLLADDLLLADLE